MKYAIVALYLFCCSAFAQPMMPILDSLASKGHVGILVREDGSIFGQVYLWQQSIWSDTLYIIVSDSTLVRSRLAHDDALWNTRTRLGVYQKQYETPENQKIFNDIKKQLEAKGGK